MIGKLFLRVWGKIFCRKHFENHLFEKPTGRIRPYVNPYANGRGRLIFRGIQVITYNEHGKRISPPTKDEKQLELVEFEAPCAKCGNKVRYWRDRRKRNQ